MVALTQYRKTIKGLPKIDYKADYKNINIAAEDLVSLSIFGKSENRLLDFHRYFNIENKKVVLTPFDTENSETSFLRHNLRIKTIHGMQNV
ncbi:hypothetical protein MHBO_004015 [Bonamia ostreae]|uniref:Uncharacterized protein n=1 Tax=Bonamia ostreae TaxID=126728 RepID=A0ABV2AS78_9EUKA